jgi:uncharacterized protein YndB with AHSA1/START domain
MRLALGAALATLFVSAPAAAEVKASSDSGFVVAGAHDFTQAIPEQVWDHLIHPETWWSSAHSWSGNAANMALDARAGGCFCEAIPGDTPESVPGTVEHMRVIHVRPGSQLVMRGSLGPLQAEALTGTLTVTLEQVAETGATRLSWTYVIGGYARFPLPALAPAVDGVLAEQMGRLQARIEVQ